MAQCEVCGNDYDKSFTVEMGGKKHTFDSFECAIHALAPTCDHCGCHVVGHGVEEDGAIYCCAHCAHESGAPFRCALPIFIRFEGTGPQCLHVAVG